MLLPLLGFFTKSETPELWYVFIVILINLKWTFLGLFSIVISQTIKFVYDQKQIPPTLLRLSDLVVYSYIVYIIAEVAINSYLSIGRIIRYLPQHNGVTISSTLAISVLFAVVKTGCFLALAFLLKQFLQMAKEHKTLV
jgi:hypothetical protein